MSGNGRKRTSNKVLKSSKRSTTNKDNIPDLEDFSYDAVSIQSSPARESTLEENMAKVIWQPANWRTILENIRNIRAQHPAPIDTMGSDKCTDENVDEKTRRFQTLVALMLSSQTKDQVTHAAMLRLRANNLTPESIASMDLLKLEQILHPVGFYKNKAKFLQKTSQILSEKYNNDIPNNVKDLIALPGVGMKMAHICMAVAWKEITGIGVDVHVHRIANRLQWVPKITKTPEETRVALESWLPKKLWSEVNHLLVGFGQTVCTPIRPRCLECPNMNLCPSSSTLIKSNLKK